MKAQIKLNDGHIIIYTYITSLTPHSLGYNFARKKENTERYVRTQKK